MKVKSNEILPAFLCILLIPSTAFAYLDPGTGSMILQGLIAAVAIAGFTIKKFWYQIMGFFGGKKSSDILEDDAVADQPKD